jgi:hypothetical protein
MTNDAFIRLVQNLLADAALPNENPQWWQSFMQSMIFQEQNAPSGENTYPGFGDVPDPGEFTGEVIYEGLPEYDYRLKNKEWGGKGLRFTFAEVERDQTTSLAERIGTYFDRIMSRPAREMIKVLEANGNAYDGGALFQTTGSRRNQLTSSGVTLENLEADVAAADTAMMIIQTDQGEPSNYSPDTILCHPTLKTKFLKLANSTAAVSASNSGVVNVEGSYIRRVAWTAQLSNTDDWYFFNTSARQRALIWQFETLRSMRGAVFQMLMDRSRARAHINSNMDNRAITAAIEMRGIAGIADPSKVVKIA